MSEEKMGQPCSWIGVDLDGVLAFYDHWRGVEHIGVPIPIMVERVKRWIRAGQEVRIFTARVSKESDESELARKYIHEWCIQHLGFPLPVTCTKDFEIAELWDDRCVQVEPNTGRRMYRVGSK